MKEIKAIIQPPMAERVLNALHRIEGVSGVMSMDMRCTSAARGTLHPDINTKIELFVPDELVDEILAAIEREARTGRAGDGRIFVTDVERTVVIRTGEHNVS